MTFVALSLIGLGLPYVAGVLYFLITDSERGRAFYHVMFLAAAMFMMNVTKMAYAQPRLFWYVSAIVPDECTAEYGNPSGHTMLAIGYPMFLYLDIFEERNRQKLLESRMTWG